MLNPMMAKLGKEKKKKKVAADNEATAIMSV